MKTDSLVAPVLWIEVWHGILLLFLLVVLMPLQVIEPWSLLVGGLFMGVNFLLLGIGIRWVLAPFAGRGKVRAGVGLLVLKMLLFLGLLAALFLRLNIDAPSFAVGVSCLLAAIVLRGLWSHQSGQVNPGITG